MFYFGSGIDIRSAFYGGYEVRGYFYHGEDGSLLYSASFEDLPISGTTTTTTTTAPPPELPSAPTALNIVTEDT